jgi:phosphoribosyl 1,2-cyclic phosphodiesterase
MRFALLGSGSRGNATLVVKGKTALLIDCGFSARELEARLAVVGLEVSALSAIVVTHEHNDHIAGVGAVARKHKLPVWLSHGSYSAGQKRLGELLVRHTLNCHQRFSIGELELQPFPVPHDAREPCQLVLGDGDKKLGILTDAGRSTQHIESCLDGCDALVLECNHDVQMLADGPYPPSLQARVGGDLGHLSNDQSAALLARLETSKLQHLVAAHISEKNNRPELAAAALSETLGCEQEWISLADQTTGLDWREIQ